MSRATWFTPGRVLLTGLHCSALAASIWKCVEIRNLAYRQDFTWNMVALQLTIVIENNTVIITASMPTLSPIWRKKLQRHSYHASGSPFGEERQRRRNTHSEIFDGSKHSSHQAAVVLEYGKSEEHILQELQDGIMITTDVHVAYDELSDASQSQRELTHVV